MQARQEITLSGFCLSQHATAPNVDTRWTYTPYDSSYYKSKAFAKYRTDSAFLFPYFLTPKSYFVGEEEYIQHVFVPKDATLQRATLELERVHIVSHVWVNGEEATSLYRSEQVGLGCRSLGAPHRYDVTGLLKAGQDNEIKIHIDNRLTNVPVGSNSYSVSDNDQGNWNGFIGQARIILQPQTCLYTDASQIYPDVSTRQAEVVCRLGKGAGKAEKVRLQLETEAGSVVQDIVLTGDSQACRVRLEGLTRLWDDHQPNLYHLRVRLQTKRGKTLDEYSTTFGMREVSCDEHWCLVNGRRVYLRGTVDGAQFPLTGYPPMDEDYWIQYLQKLKTWGTNLVRFHSWCPPEAAFRAADSLGIYLQVECSSWPNHDVYLKKDNETARYISQEADQILQAYGNHPSFLMLAAGNEPKGRDWVKYAEEWVEQQKSRDPRHLYFAFSVGGSWPWCPANQLHVRAGLRGLDWHRRQPESMTDFSAAIDTMRVPFIGHEVGQWCSYSPIGDIPKYTGLMKPSNLILARDGLQANGLLAQADSFLLASGRLQVICYKHELERLRRTPNYGGYNLQALTDYTGQGVANEGVLNVFGDPKGYVTPQEWLQWAGEVVPLMRTKRFVYATKDTLKFSLELSNYGVGELHQVPSRFTLRHKDGRVLMQKSYAPRDFVWGGGQVFAEEKIALADLPLDDAAQLNLQVEVDTFRNDWNIWVYPDAPNVDAGEVYVTNVPDNRAKQTLERGGKVLMIGFNQVNYGRSIDQRLLPEFWNHLWMPKYTSSTHGLLIQNQHPAFRHFPTEYHSDVQWWELISRTYPMVLNRMPQPIQPLVQSIDNSYRNLRMGMMFEVRVGKGRLLMTNLDLTSKPDRRIVARQLLSSVLQYMQTDEFDPKAEVSFEDIYRLFSDFVAF